MNFFFARPFWGAVIQNGRIVLGCNGNEVFLRYMSGSLHSAYGWSAEWKTFRVLLALKCVLFGRACVGSCVIGSSTRPVKLVPQYHLCFL